MNKIRAFLRHPVLSQIVSQPGATVDFTQVLAKSQVLLVRLNAELAEATELLGTAIVLRLLEAALARKRVPASERPPFLLYADEFQRFATPTFGTLLEEARKYAVGTTLAHQRRSQLSSQLQDAAKGAVNTVCFQVGSDDAREMAREFSAHQRGPIPYSKPDFAKWLWKLPDPTIDELSRTFDYGIMSVGCMDPDGKKHLATIILERLIEAVHARDRRMTPVPRGWQVVSFGVDHYVSDTIHAFNELRDRLIALTSFDADMLVGLPIGQAAAKLRLTNGMHYSRLRFPEAISREHSATVHAMLQQDTDAPTGLPFPLTLEFVSAGQRARQIRERNRRRYAPPGDSNPPGAPEPPPSPLPPLPTQPPPSPLPIQFEVDLE
jgi:hypothetical protein